MFVRQKVESEERNILPTILRKYRGREGAREGGREGGGLGT